MQKFLIILLPLLASCSLTGMGKREIIKVDGNSITYVANFVQAPTVVFESGLGDGLGTWDNVYQQVTLFAGTFAYSRPGYSGGIQLGAIGRARTADDAAALLRQALEISKAPAPYVLVGHSIGGFYILEFARDYPELVAGLVLVDGRLPEFTEKCLAADAGMCRPPGVLTLLSPPHVAAEIRGIDDSEADAPAASDMGDIPVILLAATKPPPGGSKRMQPIWLDVQREFSDALADGCLVIAEGSGHYIQRDAPQLVVQAIRDMTEKYSEK